MGAFTGPQFLILIALAAIIVVWLKQRSKGSTKRRGPSPSREAAQAAAQPRSYATEDADHGASAHLQKDGSSPASILRCTIQTGDGEYGDFLDGIVASYPQQKFLRIVMQNDESDNPSGYWHSWDVPWSELVEIIRRERTSPVVGTNVRQADGTYAYRGPYVQTRLYKVGRGIECRLLDADFRNMWKGAAFQWLKDNVTEPGLRFSQDSQADSLYGDRADGGEDAMDGYALAAKSRAEREQDELASARALELTPAQIASLMTTRPEDIQKIMASPEYTVRLEKRYSNAEARQGVLASIHRQYVRKVIELAYAGAIPRRYARLFFYTHFRSTGARAREAVKGELVRIVKLFVQELPYIENQ